MRDLFYAVERGKVAWNDESDLGRDVVAMLQSDMVSGTDELANEILSKVNWYDGKSFVVIST